MYTYPSIDKLSDLVKYCVQEARSKLRPVNSFEDDGRNLSVRIWTQEWPNPTFGRDPEDYGGQVRAYSTAVMGPANDVVVFHGGYLAYRLDPPNELFFELMSSFHIKLPGACEGWAMLEDREPAKKELVVVGGDG